MNLFDNVERKETAPRPYSQSEFVYLNNSGRLGVETIRKALDAWFSCYPNNEKAELRSRFRSEDDYQHRSAFFELFLHELFKNLAVDCELHPKLKTTSRHPDFLLHEGDGDCYVEAILATDKSEEEAAENARKNQVYDALNNLDSPDFFITLDVVGAPKTPPSGKRMRRFLSQKLSRLNVDELSAQLKAGESAPQWTYQHEGWTILFSVSPKSNTRGQPGIRPIGILSEGPKWIDTKTAIRAAVMQKAGRYGELGHPYIIAVNVLSDFIDGIDEMEALFGDEQFIYNTAEPVSQQPKFGRARNGVWVGPTGIQNTRVSGVLIFERLSSSCVGKTRSCLYHNPWATRPYNGCLNRLSRRKLNVNKMELTDGEPLSSLFGLPDNWPGSW